MATQFEVDCHCSIGVTGKKPAHRVDILASRNSLMNGFRQGRRNHSKSCASVDHDLCCVWTWVVGAVDFNTAKVHLPVLLSSDLEIGQVACIVIGIDASKYL